MEFRELFGFEPSSNWFGRVLTGWRVRQRLDDLWLEASVNIEILEEKREKTGRAPDYWVAPAVESRGRYVEAVRLAKKAGYKVSEEPLVSKEKQKA